MEDSENNLTINFPVAFVEIEPNSTEEMLVEHLRFLMTIVPIVVPILFTLVIVIGFIGNLLVVLVVVLNKTMRNTTNILIFNLAVTIHLVKVFKPQFLFWKLTSDFLLSAMFEISHSSHDIQDKKWNSVLDSYFTPSSPTPLGMILC